MSEPFVLYASGRFIDRAWKAFGLGRLKRKPLLNILSEMGVPYKELSREEAKGALERLGESEGVTVTSGQVLKRLALTFFAPTTLLVAAMKKVTYLDGAETEDSVMLEFLAEIPRAFRPTLYYYIWLVAPKSDAGAERSLQLFRQLAARAGEPPPH